MERVERRTHDREAGPTEERGGDGRERRVDAPRDKGSCPASASDASASKRVSNEGRCRCVDEAGAPLDDGVLAGDGVKKGGRPSHTRVVMPGARGWPHCARARR
jgi:hypothetical protein